MEYLKDLFSLDYFIFFVIIFFGLLLGRLKIKNFSLGSSAVVISSLLYGYIFSLFGIKIDISNIVQNIGLILFIYTIGIQTGPSFFDAIKNNGIKFILLALFPTIIGSVIVLLISYFDKNINHDIIIGLFTGAMTSTPGLASVQEATKSSIPSIGYSVAYPFGMIGVILFIKLIPKLFNVDLKDEERKYNESIISKSPELIAKKIIIKNKSIIGKSVGSINLRNVTNCNISRVFKNNSKSVFTVSHDTILEENDIVVVIGTKNNLDTAENLLGEKINFEFPKELSTDVEWFLVTEKKIINISLDKLKLKENYKAIIIRIRRSGIDITPKKDTKLKFGDRINVSFQSDKFKDLELLFGNKIEQLNSFSFFPIALGALLGIILGRIPFDLFGMNIKLGITGGVLITSILLSYKGKTGPIIWSLTGSGNQLIRELGFLLFLVPIGISGGEKLPQILSEYGTILIIYTFIIAIGIPTITTIIAKYVFKINMISFLGILTAGMTSSASLGTIDSMTESDAHKISYASTYPFALIAVILGSQILAIIL